MRHHRHGRRNGLRRNAGNFGPRVGVVPSRDCGGHGGWRLRCRGGLDGDHRSSNRIGRGLEVPRERSGRRRGRRGGRRIRRRRGGSGRSARGRQRCAGAGRRRSGGRGHRGESGRRATVRNDRSLSGWSRGQTQLGRHDRSDSGRRRTAGPNGGRRHVSADRGTGRRTWKRARSWFPSFDGQGPAFGHHRGGSGSVRASGGADGGHTCSGIGRRLGHQAGGRNGSRGGLRSADAAGVGYRRGRRRSGNWPFARVEAAPAPPAARGGQGGGDSHREQPARAPAGGTAGADQRRDRFRAGVGEDEPFHRPLLQVHRQSVRRKRAPHRPGPQAVFARGEFGKGKFTFIVTGNLGDRFAIAALEHDVVPRGLTGHEDAAGDLESMRIRIRGTGGRAGSPAVHPQAVLGPADVAIQVGVRARQETFHDRRHDRLELLRIAGGAGSGPAPNLAGRDVPGKSLQRRFKSPAEFVQFRGGGRPILL